MWLEYLRTFHLQNIFIERKRSKVKNDETNSITHFRSLEFWNSNSYSNVAIWIWIGEWIDNERCKLLKHVHINIVCCASLKVNRSDTQSWILFIIIIVCDTNSRISLEIFTFPFATSKMESTKPLNTNRKFHIFLRLYSERVSWVWAQTPLTNWI